MTWPIVATLNRKKSPVWTRHYKRIDSAIPRATFHMLMTGQPGDVVTFHHDVTGLEIGHIKLSVNNVMSTRWVWEEA